MAADQLGVVFTSGQALATGISHHTQETRVRRGEWYRLRRGVFCRAEAWEAADRRNRHVLLSAAAQACRPAGVLSHLSAAAAWGWPLPLADLGPPWLTAPSAPGSPASAPATRRTNDLRLEVAALANHDVVRDARRGLVLTSEARSLVDCLRHLDQPDAVAIADAAAAGGISKVDVEDVLARQKSWPYADRARDAMRLIDPRRESWLESYGVVQLHRRGLPVPECQPSIFDTENRFVARADLWWRELGVLMEIDGWEKYRLRGLTTPQDAEAALRSEKEREDRLRDLGWEVVRAATREVLGGDVMVDRWWRAVDRGDQGRIRGTVVLAPWPQHWPSP